MYKAKDGIGVWYEKNLQPIFTNIIDTIEVSDIDIIYYYIAISFIKNSVALFESLKGYLRSYPVAQGMRLLMEFEADMDFLIKNPRNIKRLKKEVDKCHTDLHNKKKTWEETIIASGKIYLYDDISGKSVEIRKRVGEVFDEEKYAFYCAYAHFNLYAICDDDENVTMLRDTKKSNWQRTALIEFYPVILDKFINSLNTILQNDDKIKYNSGVFKKEFGRLLIALSNAKKK